MLTSFTYAFCFIFFIVLDLLILKIFSFCSIPDKLIISLSVSFEFPDIFMK